MAPLQQLNLKVPPAALDHWRAQAAAQGLSVRDWLLSIAGPTAAPGPAAGDGLVDRVAQLEAAAAEMREAVAQLRRSASLDRVIPPPPAGGPEPLRVALGPGQLEILGTAHLRPSPEAPATPRSGDAITTAELAEQTETNRAGWNNWAKAERVGQVRHHRTAGSWRLIGKTPAPGGGPDRWLWERVAA